ncbi:MAG: hypothetical protein ACOH2A_02755 [Sphingobacteriaceae bacterium]
MDLPIKNLNDLQTEIARLESLKVYQETHLKDRFKSPLAIFSTVKSLFSSGDENAKSDFLKTDLLGLISRFILPVALNKTLFRKSGFIVKMLITLASQKASGFINEGSVTSIIDKVKNFIRPKQRVSRQRVVNVVKPVVAPISKTT